MHTSDGTTRCEQKEQFDENAKYFDRSQRCGRACGRGWGFHLTASAQDDPGYGPGTMNDYGPGNGNGYGLGYGHMRGYGPGDSQTEGYGPGYHMRGWGTGMMQGNGYGPGYGRGMMGW